jgi:hypothetical protein
VARWLAWASRVVNESTVSNQRPGDLLRLIEHGSDRGAADEVGQAADHASDALVQVLRFAHKGSRFVPV